MDTNDDYSEIQRQNSAAISELASCCANFEETVRSTERGNREACAATIKRLYALHSRPAPKIIWCQSPWQMRAMLLLTNVMRLEKLLWHRGREIADKVKCPLWKAALIQATEQIGGSDLGVLNQESVCVTSPESLLQGWRETGNLAPAQLFAAMSAHLIPPRPLIGRLADRFGLTIELEAYLQRRCNIRTWADSFGRFIALDTRIHQCVLQIEMQLDLLSLVPMGNVLSILIPDEPGAQNIVKDFGHNAPEKKQHRLLEIFGQNGKQPKSTNAFLSLTAHDAWWAAWQMGALPLYEVLSGWFGVLPMSQWHRNLLVTTCDLGRHATAYSFYENICYVCERPTRFERDQQGRLHSETGPAIRFSDGFEVFSWHGVTAPAHIIAAPQKLTPTQIENTANSEIRRIMIQRYGLERFILDAGAELVETDEFGTLYAKYLVGDEPLVMVRVSNKTPNADGTYSQYFLRVPPTIKTAKAAVAWTFAMREKDYEPRLET